MRRVFFCVGFEITPCFSILCEKSYAILSLWYYTPINSPFPLIYFTLSFPIIPASYFLNIYPSLNEFSHIFYSTKTSRAVIAVWLANGFPP